MGQLTSIAEILAGEKETQTCSMTQYSKNLYSENPVKVITFTEAKEKGLKVDCKPFTECEYCGAKLEAKGLFVTLPWGSRWIKRGYELCQCDEAIEERKKEKAREEAHRKAMQEQAYREKVARMIKKSSLGKRFMSRTFDKYKTNDQNKEAFNIAYEYVRQFKERLKDGMGLLFIGSYGTGKTHLAAAICHELIKNNYQPVFGTMVTLLGDIRATFNQEQAVETEERLLRKYTKCDLLVIDDLGKEKPTEWAMEKLYSIINTRYEECLPVIITTNYSLEKLTERLAGRHNIETAEAIVSRIHEMCKGVLMNWDDYRRGTQ